jgi:pimeloyl-ACP methyl ester carboxylesterase
MASALAWAHCGTREIAYTREGSGDTLVLLTAGPLAEVIGAPAVELARSFRLIRPALESLAVDQPAVCATCLRDFMDALGIERAIVIADAQHAPAAQRLAELEPDRIPRVIVLGTSLSGVSIGQLLSPLGS